MPGMGRAGIQRRPQSFSTTAGTSRASSAQIVKIVKPVIAPRRFAAAWGRLDGSVHEKGGKQHRDAVPSRSLRRCVPTSALPSCRENQKFSGKFLPPPDQ
jgi:hypothetical protein